MPKTLNGRLRWQHLMAFLTHISFKFQHSAAPTVAPNGKHEITHSTYIHTHITKQSRDRNHGSIWNFTADTSAIICDVNKCTDVFMWTQVSFYRTRNCKCQQLFLRALHAPFHMMLQVPPKHEYIPTKQSNITYQPTFPITRTLNLILNLNTSQFSNA